MIFNELKEVLAVIFKWTLKLLFLLTAAFDALEAKIRR
jgi:hypothetical protein